MNFIDVIELFERDPQTEGIVMVGEIGGSDEEAAAEHIRRFVSKPVVAYIAGVTAPPGKRMGHAGAVIAGGKGTAADKFRALEHAGVRTVHSPAELGSAMLEVLTRRRRDHAAERARVAAAQMRVDASVARATMQPRAAAKPGAAVKPRAGASRPSVARRGKPGKAKRSAKAPSRAKRVRKAPARRPKARRRVAARRPK
jgi:succinyl-CoA synthetase alpha subunit